MAEIIDLIKSGAVEDIIAHIRLARKSGNKDEAAEIKKTLPGFTPSGIFRAKRTSENLDVYSHVLHLDFDKIPLEKMADVNGKICDCPYTYASFISPSGNGIKIFVRTSSTVEQHLETYLAIQKYYEDLCGVSADFSCKDIPRLCFISHDEDAFFNASSKVFEIALDTNIPKLRELLDGDVEYSPGQRNNYVFRLAILCQAHKISKYAFMNYANEEFSDLPESELTAVVNSGYKPKYESKVRVSRGSKYGPIEEFLSNKYSFRFNTITSKIEMSLLEEVEYLTVNDVVEHDLLRELDENRIKCTVDQVRTVLYSAFSKPFDPLKDYLKTLSPWDGFDYIGELGRTLSTKNDDMKQLFLRRWLIAMVASWNSEDIVNQHVLVLIGPQGIGKTTWLNNLLPSLKPYVFNGLLRPSDKDSLINLAECALINIDELETMYPKEQGELKELITKPNVRIRRPYARATESLPRRASFSASVNDRHFLHDTTGSRRFLCIEVSKISSMKYPDIHQAFSQAFTLFRDGEQYWFNPEEIVQININNEQNLLISKEEETLLKYFSACDADEADFFDSATGIIERLKEDERALGVNLNNITFGKVLTKHGFARTKKGGRWVYAVKHVKRRDG